MKFLRTLLLLSQLNSFVFGQGIGIGEKCPDVTLKRLINYETREAKFSEFWSRPTIIEFWSTKCRACLEGLPRLDSLYRKYQKQINFLLVTFENEVVSTEYFLRYERLRNIRIPTVVSDTILSLIFPHSGLPHVIWIGKGGIVQAITASKYVEENNLTEFVSGRSLNIQEKRTAENYFIGASLASINPHYALNVSHSYTYLSSKRDDVPSGKIVVSKEGGDARIHATNINVFTLYRLALGKVYEHGFGYNRMFYQSDSGHLRSVLGTGNQLYCYDLYIKKAKLNKALEIMKSDLDRLTGWVSSIEVRSIPCAILRRTTKVDKLKSKGSVIPDSFSESGFYYALNLTLKTIIESKFNSNDLFPFPVIDETGYTDRVDLILPENIKNITLLRQALANYDLELCIEERELSVILFRSSNK